MNLEAIASFDRGSNRYFDRNEHMNQMYSDMPAVFTTFQVITSKNSTSKKLYTLITSRKTNLTGWLPEKT